MEKGTLLMSRSAQQTGRGTGAKHLGRMRIKCGDNGCPVVLGGVLLGCTNDFLMSKVKAVENPYRKCQRTGEGGKGVDGTENLHGGRSALPALRVNRKAGGGAPVWPVT